MKNISKDFIKDLFKDRQYIWLFILITLSSLVLFVYLLLSVETSDIKTINRYAGVGDIHFYRDVWWYFYGLAIFSVIAGLSHIAMMTKLIANERRNLGIFVGMLFFLVIFVAMVYVNSVLRLNYNG